MRGIGTFWPIICAVRMFQTPSTAYRDDRCFEVGLIHRRNIVEAIQTFDVHINPAFGNHEQSCCTNASSLNTIFNCDQQINTYTSTQNK